MAQWWSLMRAQSEPVRDRQGLYLCVAAVFAAAVGLTIGMMTTRLPEQASATVVAPHAPRVAATLATHASEPIPASRSASNDPGIAVTEQQTLVVDAALLNVFNSFLLKPDDGRAGQLMVYLKSKLSPPAYAEAAQLAERYQAYMQAHDELLAAQHLHRAMQASIVDIERVAIWREQRDRLRQRLLGDRVVQVWYQNDDAQLDQVLQEWRQRVEDARQASAQSAPPQAERYPVPHWRDPAEEARHREYMVGVLREVVTGYAARRAGR